VYARAGAAYRSSFETLTLPLISKETTGFGRCRHEFVIKTSWSVAAELLIKGEPRFRTYRGGEGDELVQAAEDSCTFSGAGSGGLAMFSTLNCRLLQRSFLMRLLQTTGLSVALMTASVAGVHAEDVGVQGAPGANGADGVNPGDAGGEGGTGGDATATANSPDPVNGAFAVGGVGGDGGNGATTSDGPGDGGNGGSAKATAATAVFSGSADADAEASGGTGGNHGLVSMVPGSQLGNGGSGGAATALATGSSGHGNATASASAIGGSGTPGEGVGGGGGDADASSTANANGSGDALSSATATGGNGSGGIDGSFSSGNATAVANASAGGGGQAIATAVATPGVGPNTFGQPGAQATSSAETVNGAMAQALSTINPLPGEMYYSAQSTAKTGFAGVSVLSTAPAVGVSGAATSEAIAQGGSGQTSPIPNVDVAAISTAVPDKAYATTLIGGASNVADALLGPGDEIFGTSILELGSSTFDFRYQGDLLLGIVDGFADITVNGAELSIGNPGDDTVINLGSFGPNIDLTIFGAGTFAIGGAVPEPSTWAMTLLGFAGLGFVGYRQTRGAKLQAA
jgi:hypothetical protein